MNAPNKTDNTERAPAHRPLTDEARRTLRLFMAHLAEAKLPNISRILIYGSRVQGNHRPDSDIDIAVVFRQENPDSPTRYKLQNRLALVDTRTMTQSEIPVSSIALWEDSLEHPEQQKNPAFFYNLNARHVNINHLV